MTTDKKTTVANLKTLLSDKKETMLEFPGMPGFKIGIRFLTRETILAIRKKATKTSFRQRTGISEELDDKLFISLYTAETIKSWEGLKLSYLEQLAPVDISGQDPDSELEFSQENAVFLMQASSSFDAFITEAVSDLGNFTNSKLKA